MTDVKLTIKTWMQNHPDQILIATAGVIATGLIVVAVVASEKDQKRAVAAYNGWVDDMNKWLNEETAKGNHVYRLDDGSYLTVPSESKQERVLK